MNKFSSFFIQIIFSFIRMIFVGGITALFVLAALDHFLMSDYGVINLIIILMSFAFFPLYFAIFTEVFFHEKRKTKRKQHKIRTLYTNK